MTQNTKLRVEEQSAAQFRIAHEQATKARADVANLRAALIACRFALSDAAQRLPDWTVSARRAHDLAVHVLDATKDNP